MCNHERFKRGLTNNDICPICISKREDVKHVIRGCQAAREVWEQIIPTRNPHGYLLMDLDTWLDLNIAGKLNGGNDTHWSMRFAITTWWIWKWRNEKVFNP